LASSHLQTRALRRTTGMISRQSLYGLL
jgi:hypothetical protein